jgi:energy-coupling factor transporter ATP-binding protein EcfA2
MTAIRLDNVTIARGGIEILRNISLNLRAGEFIGVLGPNGAGKTTLFRTILGLQPISAGSIDVFGAPPRRGNPAIGYMPPSRSATTSMRRWPRLTPKRSPRARSRPFPAASASACCWRPHYSAVPNFCCWTSR